MAQDSENKIEKFDGERHKIILELVEQLEKPIKDNLKNPIKKLNYIPYQVVSKIVSILSDNYVRSASFKMQKNKLIEEAAEKIAGSTFGPYYNNAKCDVVNVVNNLKEAFYTTGGFEAPQEITFNENLETRLKKAFY